MRQFEIDDVAKAAAGDPNAQLRVERRQEVLRLNQEKRKSAMALATPLWRDKKAIRDIYQEARRLTVETGIKHEVDHIVPIMGKKVCGLHVEANLQILTKTENIRKHATFSEPDIFKQLEKAGLLVISGKRSLKAALKVGKPVVAVGDHGPCFRITIQNEQLVVVAIGEIASAAEVVTIVSRESVAAVIIVRSVASTVYK
ncbi:hypothetical protein SAMN05660489_05696 [Pseudomonas sp. LAMO17WK12:I10]|uniref:HNH endonuclease signature motif containing protein n=1 Tax=unclassified Pseudomonas TaxID=196821 RepID=UPI000BD6159A|nr:MULTISPECIES: HNH endonuclease signature motif containing protein [unclassified Pseudomonas]PXX54659.1 hypothetical protein H160_05690 [Pseudomonas sp. LAMO17WK12:I9]SNY51450.1 hypothetical protein SAMN05660489_05696 [Pseudomonas sp. LAMO17WK12:I10]